MNININRFNDILKDRFKRNTGLMRSIKAGQAGNAFKEVSEEIKAMDGSKMLWFRKGILKIQVTSASQKQELFFKKEKIKEELGKRGVEVSKVEIVF